MIFNLIILILLFILVEFLLRLIKFFRSGKWQIFAFERKLHIEKHHAYQPHTYLGYTKSNNITNPKFPSNSDCFVGSKDFNMERSKDSNKVRIVVCGGSTVEQNDLDMVSEFDPNLTWPKALEDTLNKTDKEKTYEVMNAGCAGYTILESTIHLLTKCLPYKPDYAILYTGINDAWCIQALEGFRPDYTHARRTPVFPSRNFFQFFPNFRFSFIYQYTLFYLSKWTEKPSSLMSYIACKPNFKMTYDKLPLAAKTYEGYLRSFCGIALANNIKPILIPWLYDRDLVSQPPFITNWNREKFIELLEMNNEITRKIANNTEGVVLLELPSIGKEGYRSLVKDNPIQQDGLGWIHFSKKGLNKMGENVAYEFFKLNAS